MPTIEQVTKRLFSDKNWLKKCLIGGILSYPIIHILSFGYLYRIFEAGKRGREFELSEWDDWKELIVDGLKLFIISLIFAVIPIGICLTIIDFIGSAISVFRVLWVPVVFLVGPAVCAALYLFLVRGEFKDCLNFPALGILLQKGATKYAVPTLAFVGMQQLVVLSGLWVLLPFIFFFGGVVYFYIMARVFRSLEIKSAQS